MKSSRQEKIIELIGIYDIDTQEDLAKRLHEAGYKVTQATVSRDIKELRLEKVPSADGSKYVYPGRKVASREKYLRILVEAFSSVERAGNLVVIKTVSGMAMAAAAAFDALEFEENVGTIAGDDTIMCATRSETDAENLIEKIEKIR